jgi:acyl carrier protein
MNISTSQVELLSLISLVRRVVVDLPPDQIILGSSRFIEDIGMESVNRLMLMNLVEQEYEISLEDHLPTLIELQTVQEFADLIRLQVKK